MLTILRVLNSISVFYPWQLQLIYFTHYVFLSLLSLHSQVRGCSVFSPIVSAITALGVRMHIFATIAEPADRIRKAVLLADPLHRLLPRDNIFAEGRDRSPFLLAWLGWFVPRSATAGQVQWLQRDHGRISGRTQLECLPCRVLAATALVAGENQRLRWDHLQGFIETSTSQRGSSEIRRSVSPLTQVRRREPSTRLYDLRVEPLASNAGFAQVCK